MRDQQLRIEFRRDSDDDTDPGTCNGFRNFKKNFSIAETGNGGDLRFPSSSSLQKYRYVNHKRNFRVQADIAILLPGMSPGSS